MGGLLRECAAELRFVLLSGLHRGVEDVQKLARALRAGKTSFHDRDRGPYEIEHVFRAPDLLERRLEARKLRGVRFEKLAESARVLFIRLRARSETVEKVAGGLRAR